jgi:glycosyltransferase involved in cell wall biosynthesis
MTTPTDGGRASPPPGERTICILDDARIMGGGQSFALRLARQIAQTRGRDRVLLACPEDSLLAQAARRAQLSVASIRFPDLRPAEIVPIVRNLVALRRLIASLGPAIVVGNSARCQVSATVAMMGVRPRPPFVAMMVEQDSARRGALRILYRRLGRLAVLGANAARSYRERLPGVEIDQVNNFLTDEEFEQLRALARPRRPDPAQRVLGVLSRLIPEKGIVELVEELAAAGTDAWEKLLIAGNPEQPAYERRLRARIAELALEERVSLLGPVADAGRFLAETDTVIVPSTGNEGQPTVILEALAAGRAVIVRRPLYSEDYAGLGVVPFANAAELREALLSAPDPVAGDGLRDRFGAEQALAALERAAVVPG